MCLIVYIATQMPLSPTVAPRVRIRTLADEQSAVRQWFSAPNVTEISTDQGCGCGFRRILSEELIEYFDGMFDHEDADERRVHTEYFGALLQVLEHALKDHACVELYPVWIGEEQLSPTHAINQPLGAWSAERGFLHERFLYQIRL